MWGTGTVRALLNHSHCLKPLTFCMISISLKDSNGNSMQLNDVVLIHYANPSIKYLGVLQFFEEEACFIISDNDGDYEYWHSGIWSSIEKVCDGGFAFSLDHYFGRNETTTTNMMKAVEEVKSALEV